MLRRVVIPAVLLLLLTACSTDTEGTVTVDPTLGDATPAPSTPAPTTPAPTTPAPTTEPSSGTTEAEDGTPSATPTDDVPATPTTTPDPTPDEPATVADPGSVDLVLEEIARLSAPIAMAVRPGDDTLWVAERAGRVVPVQPDGTVGEAILDISGDTTTGSERGLLGLTWSADGDTLYLSYTDTDGANVLAAVPVSDGILRADDRRALLTVPQPASNHNGGDLQLGPDGYLWWALGDGGAADDRFGNGQRPDTLLGAMLRIDPDGGDPYGIPADNPWADGGEGAPEVWAYGLRNPWRFAFDTVTDTVWIADVGQNSVEEIDRVGVAEAGLNYGWPHREGDEPFDSGQADGPTVEPVHTYTHGRGCSITGGRVYRGNDIDALRGAYLYTDFCDGRIFALVVDADGSVVEDVDTGMSLSAPVAFGEGADGALYVLSLDGPIHEVTAR